MGLACQKNAIASSMVECKDRIRQKLFVYLLASKACLDIEKLSKSILPLMTGSFGEVAVFYLSSLSGEACS